MPRVTRDFNPEFWDSVDDDYDDDGYRVYTDAWCARQQTAALRNFDLNMAYFATLDADEFELALQQVVAAYPRMVEVADLSDWDCTTVRRVHPDPARRSQ